VQPSLPCPKCGAANIIGTTICRACGYRLPPSSRLTGRSKIPPTPKISESLKINQPPPIPSQKKIADDKGAVVTKGKAQETEQNGLIEGALKAQIATACILGITLAIAIVAALIAYSQFQAFYNDYQARTRPYLVIQEFQFYETSSDSMYLLIDVTNSGERPATNISIEEIQVCVVSEDSCQPLKWRIEGGEKETILYPGRINTARIYIDKNDYLNIPPTYKIVVNIEYSCGDKEYWYEASLRLRPNSDVWRIESEKGN